MARDPAGELRRVKVLSSGAVRGRVRRAVSDRELELELPWTLPEGFLDGWAVRLLSRPEQQTIERHRSEHLSDRPTVALSGALPAVAGSDVELISPEESAVLAARLVTGTPAGRALPPIDLRLATTRGTNALLERRGADVALFVTRGFADLLEIGNQQRPDLFALEIRKPPGLFRRVVEVDERLGADGVVVSELQLEPLAAVARELLDAGIRVAAVSLLHSYRNGEHEARVATFLEAAGFEHVSVSSELAPFIRYLPRAETAVVDAYLTPVISGYVDRIRRSLGISGRETDLMLMTSAGGLVGAERFRPKDSLLSGPAGGVVGAAGAGRRSGFERVIAFDMGGTSTDVSRVDGEFDYRFETRVGAARLMSPALAIETVAAGGGSICGFDGARLRVGPESAGADPGPACYGAGGPLSLTDVNLLLGRLVPGRFEIPIDPKAAERRLAEILERLRERGERELDRESLLAGFLRIANERMAEAVRRISVREGYDPGEYALVAFGGAGAQHGCALARLLGMRTVLVPRDSGLLSALGLGHAVVERFSERQVLAPLAEVRDSLAEWIEELGREARSAVASEGVPAADVGIRLRLAHLRLVGQDSTLAVDLADVAALEASFDRAYRAVYGYRPEGRPIEVESLRVVASSPPPDWQPALAAPAAEARPVGSRGRAWFGGEWLEVPHFERQSLSPGASVSGPCLILERHSATVVESDWRASVDATEALVLTREKDDA